MRLRDIHMQNEVLKITNHFKSPNNEESIVKGVPIKLLPMFKIYMNTFKKKVRYKYRGPSIPTIYQRPHSFCHMNHALTFAVYKR